MKKFFKVLGIIAAAAVLAAGGYVIGSHDGMDSISSALPHVSFNRAEPSIMPDMPELPAADETGSGEKPPAPSEEQAAEPEITGRTVVKTDESAAREGWTLINKYDGDLTGSGESFGIALYTSAQTEDGEILWDDGQNWVAEISDGSGGYYVLLDRYISNGSVYFEVVDNAGEKAVNLVIKTGAGMEIKQYTYSKNGFTEASLYSSGDTNTLYSSLPNYR